MNLFDKSEKNLTNKSNVLQPSAYQKRHFLGITNFVIFTALLGPVWASSRKEQFLINLWLAYAISAIGFYLIFGLAGRFAFSHTFMMGLGAYTSSWVTRSGEGKPFLLGLLVAVVVAALVAGGVAFVVRRTKELYFAIATLALGQIGQTVFSRWEGFSGSSGQILGVIPPNIFGKNFTKDGEIFWLFLGVLAAVLLLVALIVRSPFGRDTIAARDNPVVAASNGVRVVKVQVVMFAIGSALAALSGALIAHWTGAVSSGSFSIELSIGIFLMLILGGKGSIWGPVVGSMLYVAVPHYLSGFAKWQDVIYGIILIIVIVLVPNGLAAGFRSIVDRVSALNLKSRAKKTENVDVDN